MQGYANELLARPNLLGSLDRFGGVAPLAGSAVASTTIGKAVDAHRGCMSPPPDYTCSHCGAANASRNALFRHLSEKCDPSAASGPATERVALCLGYVGTDFYGCGKTSDESEAARPTVEGAVLAAAAPPNATTSVLLHVHPSVSLATPPPAAPCRCLCVRLRLRL